ncbi:hypothetical protein J5N97_023449 [Dioscorea zingiberensis]|uniref:Proton gradient regulation 5 n=1 Tax=Dioscorea zingiberensis TaxID=325984 RepID=A0A9D5C4R2_9LILI|nr:hypothetical protein J5N97_023449 [Dioscorea zingiberensis]
MAASISFNGLSSSFHGSWSTSFTAEDSCVKLLVPKQLQMTQRIQRSPRMMASKDSSKGIFAPLVVFARNILGRKTFNQLRGKGIAIHSQVITEFCKSIGADGKQRQGLIRLAKKNGERLGFLA